MLSDRDAKIIALYREGKMMKEIALAAGVAANSVVNILRRHGIERPSKPQKRWRGNDDIQEAAKKLWEQGLCTSQIAERLNRPRSTIEGVLCALGIRDAEHPRHRYDGIGQVGKAFKRSRKSGAIT